MQKRKLFYGIIIALIIFVGVFFFCYKSSVYLDTPYISQTENKVYNGCEVACLLMALQYKGYLEDVTLQQIAEDVPKSDNPHEGFYLDIFGVEPRNEVHWIAPDALAKFGREYSKNDNVKDITGTEFKNLIKELKKGNPVIIYLTGGNLYDPVWKNDGDEIPVNLHILLLVGYNSKLNKVIIKDPVTRDKYSSKEYYSYDRVKEIYDKTGKKAVVVR